MADLVVPQLGESISEAVVAKWLKQVGDAVADGEPVAELETDKITVELPSPVAGALSEQRFAVGATVKVGDVIGAVDAGKAGKQAAKPAPAKPAAPPQPAAQPAAKAAPPATQPSAMPAPARPTKGNGESALDKDQLLRLTPSQRVVARETGTLPARGPAAAPAAPSGPSVEERLAQVDPRDEVVPMSPLRK